MKIPALSKRVAVMANFAMLFYSTIRRRLQVVTPDGQVLDVEHTARQGVAGGYPSLNGDGYVYTAQLGSGATGAGSRFLADDYTWKAGGGGGVTDHTALTSLAWSASGHTGTANRIAGFDGSNAATYLTGASVVGLAATHAGDLLYGDGAGGASRLPIGATDRLLIVASGAPAWASPSDVRTALSLVVGTNVQAWGADLDALEALASTGIAVRTASNTWAQRTITSSDSTVTITNPGGVAGNIDLSAAGISAVSAVSSSIPCGCGVAGDVTFDGTTSVSGFGAPSSRIYTCPTGPELEYDDVTIDTTGGDVTIIPAGVLQRLRSCTILGSGTVRLLATGGNASGTTAGAGAAVATSSMFYAGVSGAGGRNISAGGAGGTGVTSAGSVSFGRDGLVGADCKDGVTVRAGGTLGNASRNYATTPNTYGSLPQFATSGALYLHTASTRTDYIAYGAPAHGGSAAQLGAGGSAASGGGGGSGCPQVWCIGTLDTGTATLIIDSGGGNGASATTSVNAAAGGGSGGNASLAMLFVNVIRGSVAVQVKSNGGNGGNGSMVGTGVYANGGPGGHGNYAVILYGSAVTTPTASATAGTSGTPVGVGYAALGTPVAGTTIVTRLT